MNYVYYIEELEFFLINLFFIEKDIFALQIFVCFLLNLNKNQPYEI